MPTYEYECPKCNKKFEQFQKMSDKPLNKCPFCAAKPRRLISSGAGLIFKGKGFYATDYKNKTKDTKDMPPPTCPAAKTCGGCQGGAEHTH
ncbi:MAG: FmdB family zinc ribbon protein [Candidatus Omnitrophota bacterium]